MKGIEIGLAIANPLAYIKDQIVGEATGMAIEANIKSFQGAGYYSTDATYGGVGGPVGIMIATGGVFGALKFAEKIGGFRIRVDGNVLGSNGGNISFTRGKPADSATPEFVGATKPATGALTFESRAHTLTGNEGGTADALLLQHGVTNAGLRQNILNTGFNPAILADASPATLTRFHKLFQGSFDAGKAFKGRLGNLATRARTIETAVAIDRAGLKVQFEREVRLVSGQSRFVDVAALNAAGTPIELYQLYKATQAGTIPARELTAAADIFKATNLRPTMIKTGP